MIHLQSKESKAYNLFKPHLKLSIQKKVLPYFKHTYGHQNILQSWRNIHKNKRGFILGNGPSLNSLDLSFLRNEYTLGSNKIYANKNLPRLDYLISCDPHTLTMMGEDFNESKAKHKLVGLQYASYLRSFKNIIFFNFMEHLGTQHMKDYTGEYLDYLVPKFSNNFAEGIFNLGNATHILLQLAIFLGFTKIYLIGVDHNYGELPKLFDPGHIEVTPDNYEIIKKCHFNRNYYKIGDKIGVPDVKFETLGYSTIFKETKNTTRIFNAGQDSKLDVFPFVEYKSLF